MNIVQKIVIAIQQTHVKARSKPYVLLENDDSCALFFQVLPCIRGSLFFQSRNRRFRISERQP